MHLAHTSYAPDTLEKIGPSDYIGLIDNSRQKGAEMPRSEEKVNKVYRQVLNRLQNDEDVYDLWVTLTSYVAWERGGKKPKQALLDMVHASYRPE